MFTEVVVRPDRRGLGKGPVAVDKGCPARVVARCPQRAGSSVGAARLGSRLALRNDRGSAAPGQRAAAAAVPGRSALGSRRDDASLVLA